MGVGFWKSEGPILLMLPNLTALILLAGTFLVLNWPPISVKTTAIRINREHLQYERLEKSRNCSRSCLDGAKPKECYFKFKLEPIGTINRDCSRCFGNMAECKNHPCTVADGFERIVMAVNGQLPGTPIQVCEGDVVVVDVENHLQGLETSIHWHGQLQHGTPYMDGAIMITQCPIGSGISFRYKFQASNPGTHFYHSHYVSHHADGIFGPFIVRQTHTRDPQFKMYDHDLDDHVITIAPWSHSLLSYNMDLQENTKIYSLLINGKGNFHIAEIQTKTERPKTEFVVKWGKRYRFRIINAASLDCPVHFQVERHNLTIIAADGAAVKPTETSLLVLYPGERYDVVLHAKEKESSYWIQVRGHHKCKDIHQEGLLIYNGAITQDSSSQSSLNALTSSMLWECSDVTHENCNIPALKSLGNEKYSELDDVRAEQILYIPYDVFTYDHMDDDINFNFELDKIPYYPSYLYNKKRPVQLPQVNGMTFSYPPSPLLSQWDEVPDFMLCKEKCSLPGEFCECLNIVHVPFNVSLDIVLVDQGWGSNQSHTFHLHGYNFHVLGSRSLGRPLNLSEIKYMDSQGNLSRNLKNPSRKDTIVIPNKGYAILRLFTNNPGYWLFEAQSTSPVINEGMQFVLHVGEQSQLPPIPSKFPHCGTLKGPNFIF